MAMEVVHIALAEMSQSTMDIVGIEESSMFPVDLFTASLPKTHVPVLLTFGAQDLGFSHISNAILWSWDQSGVSLLARSTVGRGAVAGFPIVFRLCMHVGG